MPTILVVDDDLAALEAIARDAARRDFGAV
jgi:hypothetical protein